MSDDIHSTNAADDPSPASVDPARPHHPVDERLRAEQDGRSLPPNPQADTAYGPIRGSDPADPEGSAQVSEPNGTA